MSNCNRNDQTTAAQAENAAGGQSCPPAAELVIQLDGKSHSISPAELVDPARVQELLTVLNHAIDPVEVILPDVLALPDEERWAVFKLVTTVAAKVRLKKAAEAPAVADLLEFVLGILEGDADMQRCMRGRRAALEAAVLLYPQDLVIPCSKIAKGLKAVGVSARADTLARDALSLMKELNRVANTGTSDSVLSAVPDAPVSEKLVVPPNWRLSAEGVQRIGGVSCEPIQAPVVITGRFKDVSDAKESLRLEWQRGDSWLNHVVERAQVLNARDLIALAERGLPVNSNNAKDLVSYLSEFEAANICILPVERVSRQLGWQGNNGDEGFLWGRQLITAEESIPAVDCEPLPDALGESVAGADAAVPAEPVSSPSRVVFRGVGDGDEQLASGYKASGSNDKWQHAVRVLADFPKVQLGVYASLAPPLLEVLGAMNFVVDFCGQTSQGKTTTLRIAASCWGCPDERAGSVALATWDATRVWIERASAVLNSLPVILDDTKRCRKGEDIAQTIYDVTSGRGRARGALKGTNRSETWRTVMLSSGEAPITSFTQDAGTHARVLKMWGSPFGAADAKTAVIVKDLDLGVRQHYGHAGPDFVQYLLNHKAEWPVWRELFRRLSAFYAKKAGDNSVGARMADHFAVLTLCAILAHRAGVVPWKSTNAPKQLWDSVVAESAEADKAAQALSYVLGWAGAHKQDFYDPKHSRNFAPTLGWAGHWEKATDDPDKWAWIGFFPHRLCEVLKDGGYDYDPTIRTWKDRGWLLIDPSSNKARHRARIDGSLAWLIAIRRDAAEKADGCEKPASQGRSKQNMKAAQARWQARVQAESDKPALAETNGVVACNAT